MRKTAYFYILKETVSIFLIGLLIFTVLLLMDKILRLIEFIAGGVSFSEILKLIFFISPSFLLFTIPMALLLGILLSFGRLSGDSEITAFKASGMSLYQLYLPIAILSVSACLFTYFLVFYGLPWGNQRFTDTLFTILKTKADIDLKERVFNDFNNLVIYVDKIPVQGKKMEGILIYNEREKEKVDTIFAKEGFLVSDPESKEVHLKLFNGELHRIEIKENKYQKMEFGNSDVKLEIGKMLDAWGERLKERELSIGELKKRIADFRILRKDTTNLEIELHKRYAFPFACIVFGLIGVPLGIQPRRSGRSYGFIITIFIILGYYISLTIFQIFGEKKIIPLFLSAWAPNILFGGLGIYLLIKTAKESPFKPLIGLMSAIDLIQQKWKGLFKDV